MGRHIILTILLVVCAVADAATGNEQLLSQLRSLPNVVKVDTTDIHDFPMGTYILTFQQPVDHRNPKKGTFHQRVYLAVENPDSMMLCVTEGYFLPPLFGSSYRNELSEHYKTNQIKVEHRYCGESVPEGDSTWTYLDAYQAAADQHVVTQSLKKLFNKKWMTTGASKSGYTTVLYRYFYPEDVDVSVPFVAPFTITLHDPDVHQYLLTQSGDADSRAAVHKMVRRVFRSLKKLTPTYAHHLDSLGVTPYIHGSIEDYFANDVLDLTVGLWMYEDPKDFVKQLPTETSTDEEVWDYLKTRLVGSYFSPTDRFAPYMVQASHELGFYGFDFSKYADLYNPKLQGLCDLFFTQEQLDSHPYSDKLFRKVLDDFLPTTKAHILFIYGKDDPWTGDAIDDKLCTDNVKKFIIPGNHRTEIFKNTLPEQRKTIVGILDNWLYAE